MQKQIKIFTFALGLILFLSTTQIALAVVNTYTSTATTITCSDATTNCGVVYSISSHMETNSTGGTVTSPSSVSVPSSAGYNVLVGLNSWDVACSSSASACSGTIFGYGFSAVRGQDLAGGNTVTSPIGGTAGSITATGGTGEADGTYLYTLCSQSANGKTYTPFSDGYCTAQAACTSPSLSNSAAGQLAWSVTNGGNITIKNSGGATVATGSTSTGTVNNLPPGSYTFSAAGATGYSSCSFGPVLVPAPVLKVTASDATVTTGSNSVNFQYSNTGPSKTTIHVDGTNGCRSNGVGNGITNSGISTCQTVDMSN